MEYWIFLVDESSSGERVGKKAVRQVLRLQDKEADGQAQDGDEKT